MILYNKINLNKIKNNKTVIEVLFLNYKYLDICINNIYIASCRSSVYV